MTAGAGFSGGVAQPAANPASMATATKDMTVFFIANILDQIAASVASHASLPKEQRDLWGILLWVS